MKIELLNENRLKDLETFFKRVFPKQKDIYERIKWQYGQHPYRSRTSENLDIFCAESEKNKIIGSFAVMPTEFSFNNLIEKAYFGTDYIVDERYRKSGIGLSLALKTTSTYKPYFAFSPSKTGEKINEALRIRRIGYFSKFVWLRQKILILKVIFNTSDERLSLEIPESRNFTLVNMRNFENMHFSDFMKISELHFKHDKDFLRWRYLDSPVRKYYLFKNDFDYFAISILFWHNLRVLALIDYTNQFEADEFNKLLYYLKEICIYNSFDGILAFSTHSFLKR